MLIALEFVHGEWLALTHFLDRVCVLFVCSGSHLFGEVVAVELGEEPASVVNRAAGFEFVGGWFSAFGFLGDWCLDFGVSGAFVDWGIIWSVWFGCFWKASGALDGLNVGCPEHEVFAEMGFLDRSQLVEVTNEEDGKPSKREV